MVFHCMGITTCLTQSAADGCLGHFQFGAVANKAAMHIHSLVRFSLKCTVSFLSGKYRAIEWLGRVLSIREVF